MKRGTPDHPKAVMLQSELDVPRYVAVGLLESLWHWTAQFTPDGAIGRYTNAVIARGIGWDGDPDVLINALVTARWIDKPPCESQPQNRLIVHDWSEHADDAVHVALARAGRLFADGTRPKMTRLSKDERAAAEAKYAQCATTETPQRTAPDEHNAADRTPCTQHTHTMSTEHAPPKPRPKPRPKPLPEPCPAEAEPRPSPAGRCRPPTAADGSQRSTGEPAIGSGFGGSGFGDSGKLRQRVSDSDSGQRGGQPGGRAGGSGHPGDRPGGDESPRGRAALRWLMATERFCCRGSPKQQAADATSARNMFDAFWPDDTDDPAAARKRFDEAMCIVDEIKRRPQAPDKPMAMLTTRLRKAKLIDPKPETTTANH